MYLCVSFGCDVKIFVVVKNLFCVCEVCAVGLHNILYCTMSSHNEQFVSESMCTMSIHNEQ